MVFTKHECPFCKNDKFIIEEDFDYEHERIICSECKKSREVHLIGYNHEPYLVYEDDKKNEPLSELLSSCGFFIVKQHNGLFAYSYLQPKGDQKEFWEIILEKVKWLPSVGKPIKISNTNIDYMVEPIILELASKGYETIFSCQGHRGFKPLRGFTKTH